MKEKASIARISDLEIVIGDIRNCYIIIGSWFVGLYSSSLTPHPSPLHEN
jgi:hypothetical protein